jgi:hypothetical protein
VHQLKTKRIETPETDGQKQHKYPIVTIITQDLNEVQCSITCKPAESCALGVLCRFKDLRIKDSNSKHTTNVNGHTSRQQQLTQIEQHLASVNDAKLCIESDRLKAEINNISNL